jgi:amidase
MKTAIPFGPREPVGDFKPAFATAVASAAAIRRKSISATELLNLTLRRVDLHNPTINAIVWQDRERARARARQADEMLAQGRTWGPLHGVPVTIKEAFAYQGSPNTWGLPPLKNVTSARTAVAVERLESAGAIVIGKTNVPVMLGDWQSYNPIFGTTNNPWDVTRTPGGSTGGGAAALAAGFGCLTLGSDLSGSIRIPAHFCGVYGHKPTLELVSAAGFQPGPWDGSGADVATLYERALAEMSRAGAKMERGWPQGVDPQAQPAGMQIMAPMWEDGTSIEFAALLAETFGGFTEPPALRE